MAGNGSFSCLRSPSRASSGFGGVSLTTPTANTSFDGSGTHQYPSEPTHANPVQRPLQQVPVQALTRTSSFRWLISWAVSMRRTNG